MRDGGSIILVGSGAGHKGVPGYTTCSATKAALRSFARTWTAEFKNRGIRVNNLSVGPIETPMIDSQADTKGGADAIRAFFVANMVKNAQRSKTVKVPSRGYANASSGSSIKARFQKSGSL
jgi:NAD(P)-dependent dehydrogenase (short-subunit alcohol dehydrogenase family)